MIGMTQTTPGANITKTCSENWFLKWFLSHFHFQAPDVKHRTHKTLVLHLVWGQSGDVYAIVFDVSCDSSLRKAIPLKLSSDSSLKGGHGESLILKLQNNI